MNEPYFRHYHLLPDQQPDVEGTARLAEHADPADGEYRKNLLLETMTNLVVPEGRGSLYDQGPIFGELPCWYSSSGSPSQRSLFVDRDFDWRTARRGPHAND